MLTQTRTLRVDGSEIYTNAMVGIWARPHGRPPPPTNNKFLKFMAFTPPPQVVPTILWKIHSLTGTLLSILSESKNQINGGKCGYSLVLPSVKIISDYRTICRIWINTSGRLYLDSTCSTITGQNGTWFRLGSLVKGKIDLLEPSIRKWSIVGNPSKFNVWEMGKELPAMNNCTWHILFRVLTTTAQPGQDTVSKYSQEGWTITTEQNRN